jgi:hypothetical protein
VLYSFRLSYQNPSFSSHFSRASSLLHEKCLGYLIILDFIIATGKEGKLWSSSSCSNQHSHIISSLLRSNILLSTLFSNTLSPCSYYNRITVLHTSSLHFYAGSRKTMSSQEIAVSIPQIQCSLHLLTKRKKEASKAVPSNGLRMPVGM